MMEMYIARGLFIILVLFICGHFLFSIYASIRSILKEVGTNENPGVHYDKISAVPYSKEYFATLPKMNLGKDISMQGYLMDDKYEVDHGRR